MPDTRTIYMAGELFSAKHLAGNAALADHLFNVSTGQFRCILPQDLPQAISSHEVRDQDLRALLESDAAVFQYDGAELDSGTVVEYLFAKFADIPAVLLRTDFRHGGDQASGDPWNLMNSFYPRTAIVRVQSMELYQNQIVKGLVPSMAADKVIREVAAKISAALEQVLAMPPVLPPQLGPAVYEWIATMPGFANPDSAQKLLARIHGAKVANGLL
jgi:nucleoside 2-deoxyribosyltransferase